MEPVHLVKFSDKYKYNFMTLDSNNSFINWDIFKEETYVQWVQLISVIPRLWKDIKQNKKNFLT